MSDAKTLESVSTKQLKVAERAKREPEARLLALAQLIDRELLVEAFERIRKDAAVGVDGIKKDEWGKALFANIQGLHERMKQGRYRHQPIRRAHIPKESGKTRPIGISCIEDKVVQNALTMVLELIYEPIFSRMLVRFPARKERTRCSAGPERRVHAREDQLGAGGGHRVLLRQHRPQAADGDAPATGER